MKGYGQFCSIARTLDLLGERWTLLVVRELLCGSRRFGELRRGIPRVSRTMLSARLRALVEAGVVAREPDRAGPTYRLTEAGAELAGTVRALGTWGQRWLPRALPADQLDADVLAWDVHRRVRLDALPAAPAVVRFEVRDRRRSVRRFLLVRPSEVSLCTSNPGFPEVLVVGGPLPVLTGWWRGDLTLAAARAAGLVVAGERAWVRAFPRLFERYLFADVEPVRRPARVR